MLDVYVGYDPREHQAFEVASKTICENASKPVAIHRLDADELYRKRLLWRPVEYSEGRMTDHLSDAPQSTQFAISRFLLPFIHRQGWALFVDLDVVVLKDIAELFELADDRYALMCVKHGDLHATGTKMDGQVQTAYDRKNWSSVMLVNCNHPAHFRMSLGDMNHWPGKLLHRFSWLRDEEIGELPPRFNWLVGLQPMPDDVAIAHFTLGGPWLPGWKCSEHDRIWLDAANN